MLSFLIALHTALYMQRVMSQCMACTGSPCPLVADSGPCHENAYEVDAHFLPSAVPAEPRTRHSDVEVSGSDSLPKSEAESEGLNHSLQHTGSEHSTKRLNHGNTAQPVNNCQSPPAIPLNKEWTGLGVPTSSHCQATEMGNLCLVDRPPGAGNGYSLSNSCTSISEMQPDVIVVEPETPVHSVQSTNASWRQTALASNEKRTDPMQGANHKAQGFVSSGIQCSDLRRQSFMETQCVPAGSSSLDPSHPHNGTGPYSVTVPGAGERVHAEGNLHNFTQSHKSYHSPVVDTHARQEPSSSIRSTKHGSFSLLRPFGCSDCQKKFVSEKDLKKHQVIHRRVRAFPCALCGKSFVSASQLHMHKNVHTGDKPYSCHLCWRRFSHPSNLKRHQKQVH